eukprot:CAMPEP_0185727454 /NCGR_PEP_ID=MMETSP1171-20130828/3142_1 /TAXON_ID=374046 /ORGANISM="Helicotheca tamensis, Strain CCMP826" /LENGTH=375 /DNA_ID=CAMNT_0028396029 /DNA_START=37 /DNA_END=1164 /DNA_ORIENTATION=-
MRLFTSQYLRIVAIISVSNYVSSATAVTLQGPRISVFNDNTQISVGVQQPDTSSFYTDTVYHQIMQGDGTQLCEWTNALSNRQFSCGFRGWSIRKEYSFYHKITYDSPRTPVPNAAACRTVASPSCGECAKYTDGRPKTKKLGGQPCVFVDGANPHCESEPRAIANGSSYDATCGKATSTSPSSTIYMQSIDQSNNACSDASQALDAPTINVYHDNTAIAVTVFQPDTSSFFTDSVFHEIVQGNGDVLCNITMNSAKKVLTSCGFNGWSNNVEYRFFHRITYDGPRVAVPNQGKCKSLPSPSGLECAKYYDGRSVVDFPELAGQPCVFADNACRSEAFATNNTLSYDEDLGKVTVTSSSVSIYMHSNGQSDFKCL